MMLLQERGVREKVLVIHANRKYKRCACSHLYRRIVKCRNSSIIPWKFDPPKLFRMFPFSLFSFAVIALAAVSVSNPSDVISPLLWAADNAIVPNYNVPFISVQPEALPAAYTFEENSTKIDHESFSTTLSDTSVILVANGAELDLSFVDIQKSGYASNLLWSSFYGFNAAINIVSTSSICEIESNLH
jgi:hypothetical protein